ASDSCGSGRSSAVILAVFVRSSIEVILPSRDFAIFAGGVAARVCSVSIQAKRAVSSRPNETGESAMKAAPSTRKAGSAKDKAGKDKAGKDKAGKDKAGSAKSGSYAADTGKLLDL